MANETTTVDLLTSVSNRLAALGNPEPEETPVAAQTPQESASVTMEKERLERLQVLKKEGQELGSKYPIGSEIYRRLLEIDDPESRDALRNGVAEAVGCIWKGLRTLEEPEHFNYEQTIMGLDEMERGHIEHVVQMVSSTLKSTEEDFRKPVAAIPDPGQPSLPNVIKGNFSQGNSSNVVTS